MSTSRSRIRSPVEWSESEELEPNLFGLFRSDHRPTPPTKAPWRPASLARKPAEAAPARRRRSKAAAAPQAEEVLPAGTIIDKYRIEELVGTGGFAMVYRATHLLLRVAVAIKLLRPEVLKRNVNVSERLLEEARCAARIIHPSVIRVLDVTHRSDLTFIVMEYVAGKTLRRVLDRGPLPVVEVARIGMGVAAGLRAGLAEGLIHRDVKPANILIADDGTPKVVDFGLARTVDPWDRATLAGVAGTSGYIAPEVTGSTRVDFRADIFSLGVTLFEAAVGKRRLQRDRHGVVELSFPDGFQPRLAQLLTSMVATVPSLRPSSYDQVIDVLDRV